MRESTQEPWAPGKARGLDDRRHGCCQSASSVLEAHAVVADDGALDAVPAMGRVPSDVRDMITRGASHVTCLALVEGPMCALAPAAGAAVVEARVAVLGHGGPGEGTL